MHLARKPTLDTIAIAMHAPMTRKALRIITLDPPLTRRESRHIAQRIQLQAPELVAVLVLALEEGALVREVVVVAEFLCFEGVDEVVGDFEGRVDALAFAVARNHRELGVGFEGWGGGFLDVVGVAVTVTAAVAVAV